MAVGKVVRFDSARGFGFITPSDGSQKEDVFLHANDLLIPESFIKPGVMVVFDVDEGDRGPKASNIRLPEGASGPGAAMRTIMAATGPTGPVIGDDDEACDVLSPGEFSGQITELLLTVVPSLTGEQILDTRRRLGTFARERGWIVV